MAKKKRLLVIDDSVETVAGLQHFFSHDMYIKRLNATDCADLMRLAGTWVEKGGSFAGEQGRHVDLEALKEAHRKGLPETRFPEQSGGGAHGDPAKAWSVGGGHLGSKTAYRDRGPLTETFEGKPAGIEFHLRPFMRDTKSFSGMGGMPGSGTAGKRARGNSTIKKLDKLFGFIIGCDISGTTTDMAFALDNLSFRQGGLHPGYYLLPLATLVHNNHHTILEAALALGLDEKLDYRIGFYTSLIPPQGLPPELEAIRGLLEKAESDVSTARMHLMCYYERGLLAGAFQFNRQELPALRGTVVGTEMLRAALRMQPLPGRDEVKKLLPRTSAMALV